MKKIVSVLLILTMVAISCIGSTAIADKQTYSGSIDLCKLYPDSLYGYVDRFRTEWFILSLQIDDVEIDMPEYTDFVFNEKNKQYAYTNDDRGFTVLISTKEKSDPESDAVFAEVCFNKPYNVMTKAEKRVYSVAFVSLVCGAYADMDESDAFDVVNKIIGADSTTVNGLKKTKYSLNGDIFSAFFDQDNCGFNYLRN